MKARVYIQIIIGLAFSTAVFSEGFPEIPRLESRDALFSQYQQEVEQSQMLFYKAAAASPAFYTYRAKEGDTVFTLSARCSIWQETLATANSIEESGEVLEDRLLYLPTANGIFIAKEPVSSMEILLAAEYKTQIGNGNLSSYTLNDRQFYFLPGQRFSSTERSYFLDPSMVMPLEKSVLTSDYGERESPITGVWQFHRGVDLAAPLGSAVMACKSGIVERIEKDDRVYGNNITIKHSGGLRSLYAHLGDILVSEGDSVKTGQTVAKVGLTGLTTGPHLHFEITQNGSQVNPRDYVE